MFKRSLTLLAPRIAVAMSGGIDSAVTATLLKEQGFDCVGVFMRNWDNADEDGESRCSISKDFEDMKLICKQLNIEAVEVEFIKEYWNNVFEPFLEDYRTGATPNPDVMCNKYIKFRYFKEFIKKKLDIDHMATGHYANMTYVPSVPVSLSALPTSDAVSGVQVPILMRGIDRTKDQSYFLTLTDTKALQNVLFPLGKLYKSEVKAIARAHPLLSQCVEVLSKKESMGLCFVGKRTEPFGHFLGKYIELTPGRFIDVATGQALGTHTGAEGFTIGQKANIHSQKHKYYIVSKTSLPAHDISLSRGDILVAEGRDHPLLFKDRVTVDLKNFQWSMDLGEDVDASTNADNNNASSCAFPAYLLNPIITHLNTVLDLTAIGAPDSKVVQLSGPTPLVLPYHGQAPLPGAHALLNVQEVLKKYLPGVQLEHRPHLYQDRDQDKTGDFNSRLFFSIKCDASVTDEPLDATTVHVTVFGLHCMHRYHGELAACSLHFDLVKTRKVKGIATNMDYGWDVVSAGELDIRFTNPQRAITSGQILALYDGEYSLGGGTILR